MLFVPINAESEGALDERNAKTVEQQQAEIARVTFGLFCVQYCLILNLFSSSRN